MRLFIGSSAFLFACVLLPSVTFAAPSTGKTVSCDITELADIQGMVKLSPQCTYKGGIIISRSNVTLDCQGAIFDGGGRTKYGIHIQGQGAPVSNVTIENCKFVNFGDTAIRVTGLQKAEFTSDIQDNYKRSARNITISHSVMENSRRSGVFFAGYVSDSSLHHSIIKGSGGPGIYLDQASGINIHDNVIESNGRLEGRKTVREGLAIDASAKNIIRSNIFKNNAAGAIFLYKNCGENFTRKKGIIRWQSSNDNVIEQNTFIGEEVGVWLASRQSRNLRNWDCGDRAVDAAKEHYEDYANYNAVANNKFCGVKVAIRNEGDNNRVVNNTFDAEPRKMVVVPYRKKPKPSGELSVGNVSTGNTQATCDIN